MLYNFVSFFMLLYIGKTLIIAIEAWLSLRNSYILLYVLSHIDDMNLRRRMIVLCFVLAWFFCFVWSCDAQLQVATIERKPFVFTEYGQLQGFSIDLLREISKRTWVQYELIMYTVFSDMLDNIANKQHDIALANISITAEREQYIDFSYPIFDSGIQIVKAKNTESSLQQLIAWTTLSRIVLLLLIMILVHLLIEKYGYILARIPTSWLLTLIWLIWWWFIVIQFSSSLASTVSASQNIEDPSVYLVGKSVWTSRWTTMSDYLDEHGLTYISYDDFDNALQALESWKVDYILWDAAVIRYYAFHEWFNLVELVWQPFSADKLAIAFKEDHTLRELFNKTLLEIREDGTYGRLVNRYFWLNHY